MSVTLGILSNETKLDALDIEDASVEVDTEEAEVGSLDGSLEVLALMGTIGLVEAAVVVEAAAVGDILPLLLDDGDFTDVTRAEGEDIARLVYEFVTPLVGDEDVARVVYEAALVGEEADTARVIGERVVGEEADVALVGDRLGERLGECIGECVGERVGDRLEPRVGKDVACVLVSLFGAVLTLGGLICATTLLTLISMCGISYLSLKFNANID